MSSGSGESREVRTAVVTGASRGLGLALTTALVGLGWRVVADARDADELHAALDPLGPQVAIVPGDVADPDHRRALVVAAAGPIHLVVNNGEVSARRALPALDTVDPAELASLFETNVVAPLGLIQAALPTLDAGAVIVNITSDASVEAYEGWGVYGTTEAALDHLGAVLAVEHPELRVLSVDPGDMQTRMRRTRSRVRTSPTGRRRRTACPRSSR